jgi:hypothetical protein
MYTADLYVARRRGEERDAEARRYEAEQDAHVAALLHDARLKAGAQTRRHHLIAYGFTDRRPSGNDEVFVRQLG